MAAAPAAPGARLTSSVVSARASRTNTSSNGLSSAERLVAVGAERHAGVVGDGRGTRSRRPRRLRARRSPGSRERWWTRRGRAGRCSSSALTSSAERLSAADLNATKRPEGEIAPKFDAAPAAGAPAAPVARLTSVVVAAVRSRTKTFGKPSSSSFERLSAREAKATRVPSSEIAGANEMSFAPAPLAPDRRLTRTVVFATRSRTKRFLTASSSAPERLSPSDSKAT